MLNRGVVVVLFACVVGCGERTPAEKCTDLVDDICGRATMCLGGAQSDCVQAVEQSLPCGKATSVGQSYDACVDEVNSDSCPVLFPTDPNTGQPTIALPADCQSVIILSGS